jgi:hypothetical protein
MKQRVARLPVSVGVLSQDWVAHYVVAFDFNSEFRIPHSEFTYNCITGPPYLGPKWDTIRKKCHTRSNARKNLGAGAEPPVRIHIIKKDFDFNLLIFYFEL